MAELMPEFEKRNTKIIGLSVDPVGDHTRWSKDIEETQGHRVTYPLIGDPELSRRSILWRPRSTGNPAGMSSSPARCPTRRRRSGTQASALRSHTCAIPRSRAKPATANDSGACRPLSALQLLYRINRPTRANA